LPGTIDWREWSQSVFGAAAADNKPILLSLVTAWSEECQAMDATTYAHPAVLAIVESRFIPIRVDADRRPDLNERYNLGGWPTTAALTPDGDVLNGGTYFGVADMIALLTQAADAWRDRGEELRARIREPFSPGADENGSRTRFAGPDENAVGWFRSLLLDQFDSVHGGFGTAPKYPHAGALAFALALACDDTDESLRQIVEITLERLGALWDSAQGGFYRYAERPDWTQPATEKTTEDNAALLNLYLDAAVRLQSDEYRNRAGELVRWIKATLADQSHGGFYNSQAAVSRLIDRSMYVDRNADMVAAFLRAAAIFQDPWLRDFAVKSFERVIVPGYKPGHGVSHVAASDIRGLLGDQIRTAAALIWSHIATGQLPYSMLALELVQFAVRTMWDEDAACFRDRGPGGPEADLGLLRDPARPFALNCDAACVLDRLATMTGDQTHRERALTILGSFAGDYHQHGLFAAPYALAVREVVERRPPPGLNLSRVEWNLEHD
jgi:uncharacterized protein